MSDSSRFPFWRYLSPQHWPLWFGLGLLRLCALLPYGTLLALGRGLGRLFYWLVPSRRRVADANLRLCYPHLDADAREALVRANFASSGIAVIEMALAWYATENKLRPLVRRIEGLEHVHAARAAGKGALLLGGHYTTLEISARLMALHDKDFDAIYKHAQNPFFDAVMLRGRHQSFDTVLDNKDMRAIVRRLKAGRPVWYAPDQDFGRSGSVFAPFFGVPTATLLATARLARLSGSPVLPFYSERLPGTEGYVLRFGAPLANFPSGDDVADATAVNAALEEQIRRTPEQYLWIHKRFKTRPIGEPPVYSR